MMGEAVPNCFFYFHFTTQPIKTKHMLRSTRAQFNHVRKGKPSPQGNAKVQSIIQIHSEERRALTSCCYSSSIETSKL